MEKTIKLLINGKWCEIPLAGTIDPKAPSKKDPKSAWYDSDGNIVCYTDQMIMDKDKKKK